MLEVDPAEPQLHRLIRAYERKVDDLMNRVAAKGAYERKIQEQAERIAYLELIISNHRRPK